MTIEPTNVTKETHITNLFTKLGSTTTDIHILNAGIIGKRDENNTNSLRGIGTLTKSDLLTVFAVNTIGQLFIGQSLLNNISKSKHKRFIALTNGMI